MKLDAIGIVSADLKRAVQFYELLGLSFGKDDAGADHLEANTPNGLRIMLDSESLMRKLDPAWKKPVGQGMTLAFLCGSPAEVNSKFQAILSAGFRGKKEPWDAFWGQRYASVIDADGNAVDLFAPL
ncbi:MAG: VOC family protein [Bdellovibrionales bacterium]|nr:VOC family protein [Bdellovibrionales bacterium]